MRHPNILILYTDQQRWDALGAKGNREIVTPHLDGLAAEDVSFDHCFVQNPVCMPSLVSSDHGEWLGEHLRFGKGYPGHDAVSRVPLLVRWPAGIARRRTVSGLVEAVDVGPTLLDCCGLPIPPEVQERSWCGAPTGVGEPNRDDARMESTGWKTLRTETHRYVLHADGREHLYDLKAPWGEYRDVASEAGRADVLHALRHRLATRMIAMEQPLARTWPY